MSKHIFISINEEPGLDMFYTDHVHIELEETQEASIREFLKGYSEAQGIEFWEIPNEREKFIAELRRQPGVLKADYMDFVHPWS